MMVSPMSNMQEIHPDHVLRKVALIAAMIGCTTLVGLVIVAAPVLTPFMQPASLEARVLPQQLRNETMESEEQARQNALRELARTMQSKALAEEAARLKPRDFPADFAQTTTGAHFAARTETAIATTRNGAAMAARPGRHAATCRESSQCHSRRRHSQRTPCARTCDARRRCDGNLCFGRNL